MQHAQGHRIGSFTRNVHEVYANIVDLRFEVLILIDERFLLSPIELIEPVIDQLHHVLSVGRVVPALLVKRLRPTSALQAVMQIIQRLLRNVELVG